MFIAHIAPLLEPLGLIPVNAADNVLHLLIAAAGIAAGLASSAVRHGARDRDRGTARTA